MLRKMFILTCAVLVLSLTGSALAEITETFSVNPWWTEVDPGGYIPSPPWSNSNNAGGVGIGEFGGAFIRNTTSVSVYVADTAIGSINETMNLTLKATYKFIDNPDGSKDPEMYLGYMTTATKAMRIFYLRMCSSVDGGTGTRAGIVVLPSVGSVIFTSYDDNVCTIDLSYTYDSGIGTLSGTVAGTPVYLSGAVPVATADAFGILVKANGDPANAGKKLNFWLDDLTYEADGARVQFEIPNSGDLEEVTPAVLNVKLVNAMPGETYYVDYAATGGTATNGDDYVLAPGTLTFNPGETSKPISIDIIDEGIAEYAETIIVTLSNPTGSNIRLGPIPVHTYTIIDPAPNVSFELAGSSGFEANSPARINVILSAPISEPVTVEFAVTGGTAVNEVDYALLGSCVCDFNSNGLMDFRDYAYLANYWLTDTPGSMADVTADGAVNNEDLQLCVEDWLNNNDFYTLTFEPGQTKNSIYIDVYKDELEENNETIMLALLNPVNATLGNISTHSYIINGTAMNLKVDLGLPLPGSIDNTTPVPGTVKPGWFAFIGKSWVDMYMHDPCWERGETTSNPPATDGISGSGVHVKITSNAGDGGFAVYGMCRAYLGGGGVPSGKPVGDPIANGWFHNIDWGGLCTGDIYMRITDLPPGRYELKIYHNHWEPAKQSTRNCLDKISTMPNMPGNMPSPPNPAVYASALPTKAMATGCYNGFLGYGTGTGVTSITEAYNIDVTSTTSDEGVGTSVIVFETDGSDVLVTIVGGNNVYPDPARPDREGSKAVLNAFEITTLFVE